MKNFNKTFVLENNDAKEMQTKNSKETVETFLKMNTKKKPKNLDKTVNGVSWRH